MRAVPAPESSIDSGVPWHYGDPHAEQRKLVEGVGAVDLSHRGVVTVTGPDRLTWLHSLTSQAIALAPGASTTALILSPHGHVEHELHLVDDGQCTWITTEPGTADGLVAYLNSMRFMLRVEVADVSSEFAVVWEPIREVDPGRPTWLIAPEFAGLAAADSGSDRGGNAAKYVPVRPGVLVGREVIVPRAELAARLDASGSPAGTWALEALRVAAGVPRFGLDTDHRSIPHELGWIGPAVHLSKGCYRGQETVARVHNLGKPPRRMVLLHLEGADILPEQGAEVADASGRVIGYVGSVARHYELGAIALAVVKRSVDPASELTIFPGEERVAASQEVIVTA